MQAMILAAGRGERMRPLTDSVPKPLLLAGGKPLIAWHIEHLAKAGLCAIVINHAHLGDLIEAELGNGSGFGVSIGYSPEPEALETAGGIANALPMLGKEPFLVVNGDIYTDYDFAAVEQKLETDMLAHVVLVDNPPQHPQGDFAYDGRTLAAEGSCKLTFSGIGVYRPELFAGIVPGSKARLAPLLYEAIRQGRASAEHFHGYWVDVGTPQRLNELDIILKAVP